MPHAFKKIAPWLAIVLLVATVPFTLFVMHERISNAFSGGLEVRANPGTNLAPGQNISVHLTGGCGCGASVSINPGVGLACSDPTLVVNPGCTGVASSGTFDWRWSCTVTGAPGSYTLNGTGGANGACTTASLYTVAAPSPIGTSTFPSAAPAGSTPR